MIRIRFLQNNFVRDSKICAHFKIRIVGESDLKEGAAMENHEKNRISVEIYGHTYKMVGTESTGHMRLVASIVDDRMREIKVQNPSLDSAKLAVLTAVNSVHDYLKLKEQIELLEEELKKLKG